MFKLIAFPTEAKAEEVRQKLLAMQKEYLIEMGDAVIAVGFMGDVPQGYDVGGISSSTITISVALSEALAKVHAKAGQRFVAAPVFGRPDVAAAGQLFVITAGSADAIAAATPLFGTPWPEGHPSRPRVSRRAVRAIAARQPPA
jgi:3-hydroxyisobutyrate dehydrogenase-like beta-hydroxyacid dehydrogenase